MSPIKVLVADDHPIFREGLKKVIERNPALELTGEAADGQAAVLLIASLSPDVAVLDIDMPVLDGFGVVREAQERMLATKFIFLTMHKNEELFESALNSGVSGYMLKDGAIAELVGGIRAVAAGKLYVSPELSAFVLQRAQRTAGFVQHKPGLQELTPAEKDEGSLQMRRRAAKSPTSFSSAFAQSNIIALTSVTSSGCVASIRW